MKLIFAFTLYALITSSVIFTHLCSMDTEQLELEKNIYDFYTIDEPEKDIKRTVDIGKALETNNIPLFFQSIFQKSHLDEKFLVQSFNKYPQLYFMTDVNGDTLLHHACYYMLLDLVKILLSRKEIIQQINKKNKHGCTPLDHICGLCVKNYNNLSHLIVITQIYYLLKNQGACISKYSFNNQLIDYFKEGSIALVRQKMRTGMSQEDKTLLEHIFTTYPTDLLHNDNQINVSDLLSWAINTGNISLVNIFLGQGIYRADGIYLSVMRLIHNDDYSTNLTLLKQLLSYNPLAYNIFEISNYGEYKQYTLLDMLYEVISKFKDTENIEKKSALCFAYILLESYNAKLNFFQTDCDISWIWKENQILKKYIFWYAVEQGCMAIIKNLLKLQVNMEYIDSKTGKSIMHMAVDQAIKTQNNDIVAYLALNGVPLNILSKIEDTINTPLDTAFKHVLQSSSESRSFISFYKLCALLYMSGAELNAYKSMQELFNKKILSNKNIMESKNIFNSVDSEGIMQLFKALEASDTNMLENVLSNGTNLSLKHEIYGITALEYIFTKALVSKNNFYKAKNNYKNSLIAEFLIKRMADDSSYREIIKENSLRDTVKLYINKKQFGNNEKLRMNAYYLYLLLACYDASYDANKDGFMAKEILPNHTIRDSLLRKAISRSNLRLIKFIVEQGANITSYGKRGTNSLHKAVQRALIADEGSGTGAIIEFLVHKIAFLAGKTVSNENLQQHTKKHAINEIIKENINQEVIEGDLKGYTLLDIVDDYSMKLGENSTKKTRISRIYKLLLKYGARNNCIKKFEISQNSNGSSLTEDTEEDSVNELRLETLSVFEPETGKSEELCISAIECEDDKDVLPRVTVHGNQVIIIKENYCGEK